MTTTRRDATHIVVAKFTQNLQLAECPHAS